MLIDDKMTYFGALAIAVATAMYLIDFIG